MHLKEIQLENFKSFGRKLTVPFLEGFTAITGPNGSGKSNIADAILFVLGPRSSKAIRAGKLTDLIYNGGKTGRPEKYCKVSLVFCNEDRLIPINSDEVKLTRMVKVSPSNKEQYYSYFYVNGRQSSLTEFNDLLANAKISAEGYNFVMQGDINAITRMTPLERRRILEDVAGITRFDKDIDASEKKRVQVEENLKMINLTLNEIKTELRRLERDRKAALKYMEYKERLDKAKGFYAHKKKNQIEAEITAVQEQIAEYEKEIEDGRERVETLKSSLEEAASELDAIENEIVDKGGEEARELKEKIDALRLEIARTKDVVLTSKEKASNLKSEKVTVVKDLGALKNELKKLEKEMGKVTTELSGKQEELETKRAEYDNLQKTLAESDSNLASIQKKIIALNRRVEEKRDELHNSTLEAERIMERREARLRSLAEAEERMKLLDTTVKDAEWHLKEVRERMGSSEGEVGEARKKLYELKKEEDEVYREMEDAQSLVRELEREYTRLKTVKEVMKQSNAQRAVDALMEARDRGQLKGIHGSVSGLAEVDPEYETALSIAAGGRMNAVIVENDTAASEGISFLKRNRLGRVAFLPLNKMMAPKPAGRALLASRDKDAIGFAIDLVKYDERYQTAFNWVFGSTVVVGDLKTARKLMGGVRMVTLDGELIESSGAMVGGTIMNKQKFGSTREKGVDSVSDRLRLESTRLDSLKARLAQLREERETNENIVRESNVNDEDVRLAKELEIEMARAVEDEKRLSEEIIKLKDEVKGAEAEAVEKKNAIGNIQKEIGQLEDERKTSHKLLVASTPEKVVSMMRKMESGLNDLSEGCRELSSREATLNTQKELLTDRLDEIETRVGDIDGEIESCGVEGSEASERLKVQKEEISVLLEVETGFAKEMKDLHQRRDRTYERKVSLEKELDSLRTTLETKGDFMIGLRTKYSTLTNSLSEAVEEASRYDIEMPEVLPTIDELRKEISECEARMSALEPVNMRAVEDYEVYDQRRLEIVAEYDRLDDERKHLIKVVDELISKKKDGLLKVFGKVDVNFQRIYAKLSLGGTGSLELENKKNPFEGGLAIKAKPPNKKVLKLGLLSGGEKSLTALALILAIQEYDPSPFYLLDEVDMFLDAINAERVANLVEENAKKAQFIMISLRKVTMSKADHVYGVTMGDKGISALIGNVHISMVGDKGEIHADSPEEQVSEERPVEASAGGDAVA